MAAITSLGVRSPAALQYLISEGLLPADARPSSYTWQTDYRDEDELSGFGSEEELLQTETCVVWTQGGIVRKAFRFEVEEEKVSQAILTWFPTSESHNLDTTGAFSDGSSSEVRSESNGQRPQASGWSTKAQSYSTRFGTQTSGPSKSQSKIDNQISRARALVVILRTQAHIFFLSGTSHVVHLPFEVENVFPAPQGVLLQRKLFQSPFGKSGIQPTAPPNSFLSSQTFHSSPILTREPFPQNPSHGPAIPTGLLLELFPLSPPDDQGSLPCLFAMTDPLVEMGLVVTAPPFHQSLNLPKKRPSQASSNLSPEEKLLYMSPQAEAFNQEIGEGRPQSQLILALTSNAESNKYTVWSVEYLLPNSLHSGAKTRVPSGTLSRRRSSMGPGAGTGATTPTAYTNNSMMENMMGTTRGVGISQLPKTVTTQRQDDESIDPLVSSLDPEYDGVPAPEKQSRRVSSLLARADLSTNHDRKTFSDLATGHGTNYRGPSSTFRRGESLGSQTPRTSFGGSYNHNQRKSMPGNTFSMPRMSSGTYDPPVDELLEELNSGGDFEGFESMGLQEVVEGLKQEIIMRPLISIPLQAAAEENSKDATLAPKPKIFTITDPQIVSSSTRASKLITMCLFEQKRKKLSVLTFMVHSDLVGLDRSKKKVQSSTRPVAALSADLLELKHGSDVIDAAKIRDGDISRILVLTETKDRHGELTIQAPWSPPARISLPDVLSISNPYYLSLSDIPTKRREGSLKRVLSQAPKALLGLETGINGSCRGQVDVFDEVGRRHHLAVQMRPQSLHIRRIIDVCRYVLPGADRGGEGILVGWWAAKNWLQSKNQSEETEWTALTIILFSMALPFLPKKNVQPSGIHKTKKAGFLRSSSGASNDTESWHSMIESENHKGNSSPAWLQGSAWNWIVEEDVLSYHPPENPTISNESSNERQGFIAHCMSLTSEFLQSSEGNMAIGRRGYLPTAVDRNPEVKCTALATILIGLHLLREDQKLDIATSDLVGHGQLLPVLAQIGFWLGWRTWGWKSNSYYRMEDIQMCHWRFDDNIISGLSIPNEPYEPPSVYKWLSKAFKSKIWQPFITLETIRNRTDEMSKSQNSKNSSLESRDSLTPRTRIFNDFFQKVYAISTTSDSILHIMVGAGINAAIINTLPEGIAASFQDILSVCQAEPPSSWNNEILELIHRDDLKMLHSHDHLEVSRFHLAPTHEAIRDTHTICSHAGDAESTGAVDAAADSNRSTLMRLIFNKDRRVAEAAKLVSPLKITVVRCVPEPDWSEADLLEAQKELVQVVAIRTLAVPSGRGPLYFSGRVPLLTEKFPISGFNLTCIMKPSKNTVSADRSSFTEEKVCWAFFHAGVAAGLSISRDAKGIDTSWIVYNKPQELSNRHAGFLLALGLNGHLKSIAKWVAFKYLTPKHTMTSIGLLLGLSASYLGTMDSLVTRLLSVHVTRMLPPGAAELNLSPLTQTTGIMGIGLLYCKTQHRRMSEVMLSEIEHIDHEDPSLPADTLRDEGYRLAAGFALGFINLGKGGDLKGLHDMHLVERLLALAVGNKKVGIVHILDKSTAAATIAIAMIFMKSGDEALASKIDVPDTTLQYDYVRPDIFLLRTIAKHLILWDKIQCTAQWMRDNLPRDATSEGRGSLKGITWLCSTDLPLFNIVAGLCFAIGLRFAGSGNGNARILLTHYLDHFIRLCRLPIRTYDQRLTRSTVRNCQDLLALSVATVMAGTGDLNVYRRLRSLHGRVDADTPYGSYLATHIAIGILFLGGGTFTFGTSNLAIGALLCAFYPLFPSDILDNKSHLQAFRHFWVLATEARCLIPRDALTHRPVSIPITVKLQSGEELIQQAPCLLPDLSIISTVTTKSDDYWRVILDFANNPTHLSSFRSHQTIYVRRRAAHDAAASPFQASMLALNSRDSSAHPLRWLFHLAAFKHIDRSEVSLVLPPEAGQLGHVNMDTNVLDTRLVLASLLNGRNRDQLWNVRLILEWADRMAEEGRHIRWLGKEVVDRLRAAVWMVGSKGVESA